MGNVQSEACQEPEPEPEPEPAQSEERNPECSPEIPGCACAASTTDHALGSVGSTDTARAREASPPVKKEPSDMGGKGSKSAAWKVCKSKRWSTSSGKSAALIAAKFSQENAKGAGGKVPPSTDNQAWPTPVTESLCCEMQPPNSKVMQSQPLTYSLQKASPKEPARDISPKAKKKGKDEGPGSTKSRGQGEPKNVPRRQGELLPKNGPETPRAATEKFVRVAASIPTTQGAEGMRLGPPTSTTNLHFNKKSAPRKGTKSPEALPLPKNQTQGQLTDIPFRAALPKADASSPSTRQKMDHTEGDAKVPLMHPDPSIATKPGILRFNHSGRRSKEQAAGHSSSIPGKADDVKVPYQALHPPTNADQGRAPTAKAERTIKVLGKPSADESPKGSDRVTASPAMSPRNILLEQRLNLLSRSKEAKKEASAQSQAMKHKPGMVFSSAISYADALKQGPQQKFTLGAFEQSRLPDPSTISPVARNSVDTDKEATFKSQNPASKDDLSLVKKQEMHEQTKSNNSKEKAVSESSLPNHARQLPSSDTPPSDLNVADSKVHTPLSLGQAQQNSKVPKMGQGAFQPAPFTFTGAKPKFDWMTPQSLPENHFQFNSTLKREEKRKIPVSCLGPKDMKVQVQGTFITPTFPLKLQQAQRQEQQSLQGTQNRPPVSFPQNQIPSMVSPAILKPPIFVFPQHLKVEAKGTGLLLSQSGGQAPQQTQVLSGSKDPLTQAKTIFLPTFPCQEIPRVTAPAVFQQTGSVTSTLGKTVTYQSQSKLQTETSPTTPQVKPTTKHQSPSGTISKPHPRSQSQHKPVTASYLQPQENSKLPIQPQERPILPIQPQEGPNLPIQPQERTKPPNQSQEKPQLPSQPQEKPNLPMQTETKAQKSNKPAKQSKKEGEQVTDQNQDNSTVQGEVEQADEPPERVRPEGRWPSFQVDSSCTRKCHCKHTGPRKLPANVASWLATSRNTLMEPTWISTLKLAGSLVAGTKFCLDYYDLKVVDND